MMPPLPLLVFAVGASALGMEIAAVRLLAPYFGASTIVWANTIGVVLVALSIGYWLGGRLADKRPSMRDLCAVIMLASLMTAALPYAARPLLDVGVDALDSINAGAFVGSMIATLVLVALPVLLLGTAAPWALRIGIERVEDAGALAGRLYAVSTLGSLVGTIASALILVPWVGTRRTFLIFALITALAALPGLLPKMRWPAVVPLAILVLLAIPGGTIKSQASDGRVIFETETEYQYARVVERPDGSRTLELNEGNAVHSLYRPGAGLTGDYWDYALVLPFAANAKPPARVAVLGNAGGTIASLFGRLMPATRVDGVEIDAKLTEIGRRYFALDNPRFQAFHEDARPYLRRTGRSYDAIVVDAYRQPYIPFYLTTHEFFELARERLTPAGTVMINVGHPEGDQQLDKVLTATLGSVFEHVARVPAEPTNTLLIASRSPISADAMRRATAQRSPQLAALGGIAASELSPPLIGGEIYTDDDAPVEWLIDKSIVQYSSDAK
jgi:spermidine synthase